MVSDSIASLAAVGFSGCAVAVVSWLVMQRAARVLAIAASERTSDDIGLDLPSEQAAMPILWRLAWPVTMRLSQVLRWLTRGTAAKARSVALDRAGLPAGIDDIHLVAARCLGATSLSIGTAVAFQALTELSLAAPLAQGIVASMLVAGACLPGVWLGRRTRRRKLLIERELPFFLDLLALCVQGGLSLQGAMLESVRFGPRGVLRDEIASVLAELRSGQSRAQAFDGLARRSGSRCVRSTVAAIMQAEALGISLGGQLKEQAQAQSTARFDRAERQALKAPVKLLLPLMLFIFPCTFIVIGFPIFISMRDALT